MNKSDFYYSAEEFIFCEKHFIKHFGPCDYIFHDSSDKIPHVDIYVILPTKSVAGSSSHSMRREVRSS